MIPFKSIRIGPFTVPIKMLSGDDVEKHLGLFRPDMMTIWLNPNFENGQIEAETLLHEMLHAIFHERGLSERDKQERIVSQISSGLATALSANPRLLTYLKERLS